jgi:hypothetical protein
VSGRRGIALDQHNPLRPAGQGLERRAQRSGIDVAVDDCAGDDGM